MDKKIAGLLGAAAALATISSVQADRRRRRYCRKRQVIGIFSIPFRTLCRY